MLFLQGSRDGLADLKLLEPLCQKLGSNSELFVIAGGDHSFHMLKSTKRSDDEVLDDVADKAAQWMIKTFSSRFKWFNSSKSETWDSVCKLVRVGVGSER